MDSASKRPATILVLDVGKTNAKAVLVEGATLAERDVLTTPNRPLPGPPYPHADTERLWRFFLDAARTLQATERSIRWLERCVKAHARPDDQALFGIVQGGTDLELRSRCAAAVVQHDLPGFAIGGVAVGEGFEEMKRVVEHTAPLLPEDSSMSTQAGACA